MHPDRIGPYLIDRKIGSGGMGNVYHGIHETTQQEVAVKVLPASMAREEGFVLRFSREIQALRKLTNKHIVKLFEDGETEDGSYYYSMEFVDGETLTALVSRRKKLPWQEVIDITLQIATALKAAHDAGIVHRDLKPSNLMVSREGEIKLTDFGVAHVFATTRLTRTGGVVGTAEYMSPEQARGQRATKRSDLYSLGAVMYVMLTGRPPFTGKQASEILHQHQFAQFDKPSHYVPELPRLLEEFVCTLLEKKPEKRIPDALVLIRKLENTRNLIMFKENAVADTPTRVNPASDHTSAVASDRTQGITREQSDGGRSPATFIRDVMRRDIDERMQKSAVARFFDNTLVLVTLFILVIAGGYYLLRASVPDPAERLAQAERILAGKPGWAWLGARNDILEPLLKEGALPEQREQIQQLILQVDQYEFSRGLKASAPSDASLQSELQRLIRRAFDRYTEGDIIPATQQLQAVQTIIQGDAEYRYLDQFIATTLEDWSKNRNEQARRSLIENLLQQARSDLTAENPQRAAAVLNSAMLLYQDDAAVRNEIHQVRELLLSINGSLKIEDSPQSQTADDRPVTRDSDGRSGYIPPATQ